MDIDCMALLKFHICQKKKKKKKKKKSDFRTQNFEEKKLIQKYFSWPKTSLIVQPKWP